MLMKQAHRISGIILILFTITHLVVHLFAYAGAAAHISALESIQWIYRNPIGESLLVLAVAIQVISGFFRLLRRKFKGWSALQMLSGIYLLVFLTFHTSAAWLTHNVFGIETNFYWAAGSLHYSPLRYGFALYYFAAILSFFVHIGAALRFGWPARMPALAKLSPWLGGIVAILILLPFSGILFSVEIPPETAAYYSNFFGPLAQNP